ncbi:putative ATP-grasp superfamily ATP-dependent carboligase [Methanolinea mesophila]|uniref:ATP-grasp domain-containing protein n=1 Tax=Methanolinea mesophila TaxID=547055 RepID=UPI001AE4E424|nr:ATP-grasp domain-containing protein [Methanolinea mesophila]MBP1928202.1 putative ATP-grasp superfamily ATP-dependent carboligase [Methanolinea mesophila]
MKALLAEYAMFHDPLLAPEGKAMYGVIAGSLERCGYRVTSPEDGDFAEEIRRLAPGCDIGLVIAPDHLLAKYTAVMERLTHNIGCGSMNVAVCANKRQTGDILARHGIAVPPGDGPGKKVIKPLAGCGSIGVRVSGEVPGEGEFTQAYIEGEHLSVSLVGSRVVGNVCEFYSGDPPLVLAINRQEISIGPDGRFRYSGGETPVRGHPREREILDSAVRALQVLGCQGYCGIDIVLGDRAYVVDVNPRITTSITGIAACMEEEIADVLIAASKGTGPRCVHLTGSARFDDHGRVVRA